jgi:hypothetical protein
LRRKPGNRENLRRTVRSSPDRHGRPTCASEDPRLERPRSLYLNHSPEWNRGSRRR